MNNNLSHPFNNCGVAPFHYAGYAERLHYPCKWADGTPNTAVPPVAGGTCAHCGTGIRDAYIIEDANGKRFDVGSSCLEKVNVEPKVINAAKAEKRRVDTAKRHAKEQAELAKLTEAYETAKILLKDMPHPHEFHASQGKTMVDYYEYVLNCSGTSGKIRHLKAAILKAGE